ncbi:MAG: glycosyltransferase family 4 protein, partial [Nocardioidaceae bacterium]
LRLGGSTLRLGGQPIVWSAVSSRAADSVRRVIGSDATVSVIPNGIDAARWVVPAGEKRPDTVVVASVMRVARRKRPLPMMRMLKELRERVPSRFRIEAVIVGDGPQLPVVTDYLRRHGMQDWVRLMGRLEHPEIREVFANSDFYVAPARLESFGIAALEARCAGLPVVASKRGGVGEFISHGREGLLTSDDAEMVDAMATLVTEPGLRHEMAAHNRAVAPQVTWEEVLGRADLLYTAAQFEQAAIPTYGQSVLDRLSSRVRW